MKIIEYRILSYQCSRELSIAINSHLKQDWELWGEPFSSDRDFNQAMVKYEGPSNTLHDAFLIALESYYEVESRYCHNCGSTEKQAIRYRTQECLKCHEIVNRI